MNRARRAERPGGRACATGRRFTHAVFAMLAWSIAVVAPTAVLADIDCQPTTRLMAAGFPQRAVAYVDTANAPFADDISKQCLDRRALAASAVIEAEVLALQAEQLSADENPEAARRTSMRALAIDEDNARARGVLEGLDPPPTAFWPRVAKGWTDFQENVLAHVTTLGLAVAGLMAGLLIGARIIVSGRQSWPRKVEASSARRALGGGWLLVTLASIGLVGLASGVWRQATGPAFGVLLVTFVVMAALGVWFTAWGTARKLRVAVEIKKAGKDDPQAAAHVLSLLERFGASPPRGIERPAGPDVHALQDVLAGVKVGWIATVATALSQLFGWTPWRVVADHHGEDVLSVSMLRNGHSHGSLVLTSEHLKAGDLRIDPHIFVSAFVLTTLGRAHKGFEGLCGATDWYSLGLQYASGSVGEGDALTLLKKAVQHDPRNWLAKVDLQHRLQRETTEAPVMDVYDEWLGSAIRRLTERWKVDSDQKPGYFPLVLRMRLTQTVIRVNRVIASEAPPGTDHGKLISRAQETIVVLCEAVHDADAVLGLPGSLWLEVFRSRTAAMASHVPDAVLTEKLGPDVVADIQTWKDLPRSPSAHYSWACAIATKGLVLPQAHDKEATAAAVAHALRPALISEAHAAWLPKDPQLAWFREMPQYDEFRAGPESDLLAIAPFNAHRKSLAKLGVDTAATLAVMNPASLAPMMGLAEPAAARIIEAARVWCSLQEVPALEPVAVESVAHLLSEDLASLERLSTLYAAAATEVADGLATATTSFKGVEAATLPGAFEAWLSALRTAPPP